MLCGSNARQSRLIFLRAASSALRIHSCIPILAVTWSSPSTSANFSPKFSSAATSRLFNYTKSPPVDFAPAFHPAIRSGSKTSPAIPAEQSLLSPLYARPQSPTNTPPVPPDSRNTAIGIIHPNFGFNERRARPRWHHKNYPDAASSSIAKFCFQRAHLNPQLPRQTKNGKVIRRRIRRWSRSGHRKVLSPQTKMAGEPTPAISNSNSGNHRRERTAAATIPRCVGF